MIAAGANEGVMKGDVSRVVRLWVTQTLTLGHHDGGQNVEIARRPVTRRPFRDLQLDHAPNVKQIGQQILDEAGVGADLQELRIERMPTRSLQHDRSQPMPDLDQSAARQPRYGLTYDRAADVEAFSEILLRGEAATFGILPCADVGCNLRHDRVG